jgi:multiple sugar transport system ATP-binding protein
MSNVELRALNKRYGPVEAIRHLDLMVEESQFCALLGPSGCGKSTLLRMIAGLESVTAGSIFIGGVDVTHMAPAKRHIAMVFQSYALYPHMTVRQNIGFALRIAGMPPAQMEARISEVARTLQMEDMLDRRPAQLSGGQRQRVAIGRALVREPQVFLFDEPLSNLDAMLRMQMRVEIAKLHQDLKTTMIYVTHDQVEAMTLADKIVVLDRGVISQVGTPMELYNAPANKFVASFIGSPTMNFVGAQARPDAGRQIVVTLPAGKELRLTPRGAGLSSGQAVELGIRPEHVRLGASGDSAAALSGTVRILERLGNATIVYVDTPAGMIVVHDGGDVAAKIGDSVGIIFDPERVHLFASGKAI